MSIGNFLIAIVCPPAYCAIHRKWPGLIVAIHFWALALWLVWVGIPRWRWDPGLTIAGLGFWLFCATLALSYTWRSLRPLKYVVLIVLLFVAVVTLFQNVGLKARLAADQGTLAAMRSAITIYYGQHKGNFPASPGNYVNPTPPVFQCVNLTYAYSPSTGELKITSANTPDDCS